jgi:2-hydroxy-3-oxopropionate reductase
MSTIAFIGLGIMGGPMASHLVKAGHTVIGRDHTPQRIAALVEAGGTSAESTEQAVKDADVVAIMVPDSPDVQAVLLGDDGVFAHAQPGTLVIDFSSIRPDVTKELAQIGAERGLRVLDAPVSGGEPGAVNATLSIMVGGSEADFAAAKPLFDVVGKTIVHVGPNGSGQTVKAANQLIVAGNIELLAEAITFLQAYGVDIDAAVKVLGGGLAGSAVLDQKAQKMLDRNFDPGFRIALHHKDLGIVTAAAREAGVVIPLGAVVAQLMASAMANGDSGLDHSGLLLGVERLSGIDKEQAKRLGCGRSTRPSEFSKLRAPHRLSVCPARRSIRSTLRCAHMAESSTSSPATSKAPAIWPRATPALPPETSASASVLRARQART